MKGFLNNQISNLGRFTKRRRAVLGGLLLFLILFVFTKIKTGHPG